VSAREVRLPVPVLRLKLSSMRTIEGTKDVVWKVKKTVHLPVMRVGTSESMVQDEMMNSLNKKYLDMPR